MKKLLITLLLVLGLTTTGWCTTYYFVGATNSNWNTATNWDLHSGGDGSDGAVPTSSDNVIFDANSPACYIDTSCSAHDADFSAYTGTLTGVTGMSFNIFGSLTLGSGMTISMSTTRQFHFHATTTGETITSAGKSLPTVLFDGSGGEWILQDAMATDGAVNLYNGELNTNGQTCTFLSFTATVAGTRKLTTGASQITCTKGYDYAWSFGSTANIDSGTSTIICSGWGATFSGGGKIYYALTMNGGGGATLGSGNTFGGTVSLVMIDYGIQLSSTNAFTDLTVSVTSSSGKNTYLQLNAGQTVSGTLSISGYSSVSRIFVKSNTLGTSRTLTCNGTVSVSKADFQDIAGAGSASWDLSGATGGSGDAGGNSGITFTTPTTWYWHVDSGSWSDYTKWYSASNGGGTQSTYPPLPQDTARFDANSFDSSNLSLYIDMPRLGGDIDLTGANAPRWVTYNSYTVYGSLTFTSSMPQSNANQLTFEGRGNETLNSAGFTFPHNIVVNMVGGTLTLASDLSITRWYTLTILRGTFDADTYNINVGGVNLSDNTYSKIIYMGSGTWTCISRDTGSPWNCGSVASNLTIYAETSTLVIGYNGTNNQGFVGGSKTYNNLSITGGSTQNITISGSNTFNTLTVNAPKTVKFTDGTDQDVTSFVATGDGSNPINLTGTSTAGWKISDTAGTNRVYYCNISYSTAEGGADWLAYTSDGNTDSGNNGGWTFTSPGGANPYLKSLFHSGLMKGTMRGMR